MARDADRQILTAANFVSASRFVLLPFIVYCLATGVRWAALVLLAVSYFTDLLDGYLARKMHQETYWGRIIDPVTDKVNLAAILITLYFTDAFPLWCVLVVVVRDLCILIGSLVLIKRIDAVFPSNLPGKVTGFVFGALVMTYIAGIDFMKVPLLWLTAGLLALSFLGYLRVYIAKIRR